MKIPKNTITMTLATLLALMITGCATLQERSAEQRWESSATAVATVATYEVLLERPDWRDQFAQARDELSVITEKDEIDFWAVFEIINRLPVNELQGERAVVYATSANLVFEEFGNPAVGLKDAYGFRGFVRGLSIGIDRGLSLTGDG